jgi:hypothetical protein
MALNDFTGRVVSPGEPVTAQGWNEIVTAVTDLIAEVNSLSGSRVDVTIGNADLDPAKVRVTALSPDGGVFEAAAPVPPNTTFTLMQLVPGQYTVRASAPGFTPATDVATIPGTTALTLTMAPANPIMSDVFGQTLEAALADLATRSIVVSRVVDVTGRDIAPASPDVEFRDSPVLLQRPAVGQPVPAGIGAQLVVAASLRVEPSVEMPSLTGLTLDEVRTVLEDLGLVLGEVSTRRSD